MTSPPKAAACQSCAARASAADPRIQANPQRDEEMNTPRRSVTEKAETEKAETDGTDVARVGGDRSYRDRDRGDRVGVGWRR